MTSETSRFDDVTRAHEELLVSKWLSNVSRGTKWVQKSLVNGRQNNMPNKKNPWDLKTTVVWRSQEAFALQIESKPLFFGRGPIADS